jgi:hypothetical protein
MRCENQETSEELLEMIVEKERKNYENEIRAEIYKGKIINQFYQNYGGKK